MKRIILVLALLTTCAALSAVITSAAAARCGIVGRNEPGTGRWDNDTCTIEGGNREFIKVKPSGFKLGVFEVCAEVETGEVGTFVDSGCTLTTPGGKKWIKVIGEIFIALSGKGSGSEKTGLYVLEGGGATLECTSSEGTWKIFSEGKEAISGPLLEININTFNDCRAKSTEFKELAPKVKVCKLRFVEAIASFSAECTVETTVLFLTCTLHISGEKEAERINYSLTTNGLENSGEDLLIKAADSGITTTTSGTCPGIKGTKEAKLKTTITGVGLKKG